jgi:hypothetical protein
MAVVAILAAGIALRTSLLGSEAARLDSVALQESVELQRREQFTALIIDQDSRLLATFSQIYAGLREERLALASETDQNTRTSLELKIEADGELLQAARPMFQATTPTVVDGQIASDGPQRLATWVATDARMQELSSGVTARRADKEHEAALALVGDVAILVAALLLLTIAQVSRRRLASVAAAVGFVLAITVMFIIGLGEPIEGLRIVFVSAALGCIPIGMLIEISVIRGAPTTEPAGATSDADRTSGHASALADALQRTRALTEHLPSPEPGLSDPSVLETKFGRQVAVAIGVATLLAAVAGFMQASAFHNAEIATEQAGEHVISATSSTQLRVGEKEAEIDHLARYVLNKVSASSATHEAEYYDLGSPPRTAEAAASRREAMRWTTLADSDVKSAALLAAPLGPRGYGVGSGSDPRFPNQSLIAAQSDALVEVGLSDADNRSSALWSAQGSTYTGILALLAVTLYLLGLSLILHTERLRTGFFWLAKVGIVSALVVGTAWFLNQPDESATTRERDKDAAEHFAAGDIAFGQALGDPERDDLMQTARAELETAIRLRPDFALARQDLSSVLIRQGSPETGRYASIVDPDACHAADEQLAEAQHLGIESGLAVWDLAYCHYREGLLAGDRSLLQRAETELSTAIASLPAQGILYDNLGVTRLALGDVEGARTAYAEGIGPTRFLNTEARTALSAQEREQVVAEALTELDTIAQKRPEARSVAGELKSFVVSSTMPAKPGSPIGIEGLELRVIGANLYWQARLIGQHAAEAALSVQFYRLDPVTQEWYVIPELSGDASIKGSTFPIGRLSTTDPASPYFGDVSMLWLLPPKCPAAGRYRVEVYTGSAVASADADVADLGLIPDYDRLLHVGFCLPPDWTVKSAATGDFVAYRSADGTRGMTVMRSHAAGSSQGLLDLEVRVLTLVHQDLFPGVLTPRRGVGGEWHHVLNRDGFAGILGFMSTDDDRYEAVVRAIIDDYGSVALVVVYGPPDDFTMAGKGGLAIIDGVAFFH